jgi:hypothetical protein
MLIFEKIAISRSNTDDFWGIAGHKISSKRDTKPLEAILMTVSSLIIGVSGSLNTLLGKTSFTGWQLLQRPRPSSR